MSTIILIVAVTFLLALGGGVIAWFIFYTRRLAQGKDTPTKAEKTTRLPFRWSYIILPASVLLLAIIIAAFFYSQLPAEVAYRFNDDGSPDKWLSRQAISAWLLIPQLFLALLAAAIVWGITRLSTLFPQNEPNLRLERIMSLMGNMIGLPQLILCFAMLDIFSYNAYQTHIMPIWIFALIVIGLGSIPLAIFFIQAIRQVMKPPKNAA